jgi:hypothetical protein
MRRLLITPNVVTTSILVTLIMEALCSSETSILIRATRRKIPEDRILHSHCRENLKSYITVIGWALQQRRNVSPVRYELDLLSQKTAFFIVTTGKPQILHSINRLGSIAETLWVFCEVGSGLLCPTAAIPSDLTRFS